MLTASLYMAWGQSANTVSIPTTWVKVCDEGCIITQMAPGTQFRFGSGDRWLAPVTTAVGVPELPLYVYYTTFGGDATDPAPGVLKELDVAETATAQTVVYTTAIDQTPVTVTVPALVGGTVTPPPPPLATGTVTVTVPAPNSLPANCSYGLDASGNFSFILLTAATAPVAPAPVTVAPALAKPKVARTPTPVADGGVL